MHIAIPEHYVLQSNRITDSFLKILNGENDIADISDLLSYFIGLSDSVQSFVKENNLSYKDIQKLVQALKETVSYKENLSYKENISKNFHAGLSIGILEGIMEKEDKSNGIASTVVSILDKH